MYKPHVLAVMTNQPIDIKNDDPTNHNIHPLPKINQEWNESQPPKGDPKTKSFPREEVMIPVKCNVHPWMRAYIAVVHHPFFAVTGDDGTFTIKGSARGDLHARSRARNLRHHGPADHGRRERQQDHRFHV